MSCKGCKELVKKMKAVGKLLTKALRKGTRAGCKIIANDARKETEPSITGNLRRNVKVRAMKRNRKGVVGCRVQVKDVWYGAFQEFGTHHNKATHGLERAVQNAGTQALRIAVAEVKRSLEAM